VLIERRYAPPQIQAAYNETLPSDEAIILLRNIATRFHKDKAREVTRLRVEREWLPAILNEMPLSKAAHLSPATILKNIEERSHLLVERGLDDFGTPVMAFSHLTFQEYLVAADFHARMSTRGKRLIIDDVLSKYREDPKWWQETSVLFAAMLAPEDHREFLVLLEAVPSE